MQKLKRNDSGIWFLVAHQDEMNEPDLNICVFGIGKVNAARATQHIIDTENPKLIVNIGTAGSSVFDYGTILSVDQFVQRDMNTTEFLAPKYVTPGTDDPQILIYGELDDRFPRGTVGSGDTFVRNIGADIWDCVDMEGWATAYICRENNIPMRCYKFISDGNDANTPDKAWLDVLSEAREVLNKIAREVKL